MVTNPQEEKEAVLRNQRDTDMTYENYLCWQMEFDRINQQIVDILCNQNIVGDQN